MEIVGLWRRDIENAPTGEPLLAYWRGNPYVVTREPGGDWDVTMIGRGAKGVFVPVAWSQILPPRAAGQGGTDQ